MPRPAVNKEAARDLGTRIAKARKLKEASGGPVATDRVAAEVYAITGVYVPRSTIYNLWHSKVDPHTIALETIIAVGRYLGLEPEELGPVVADRLAQLQALVAGVELLGAGDGNRTRVLSLGS